LENLRSQKVKFVSGSDLIDKVLEFFRLHEI